MVDIIPAILTESETELIRLVRIFERAGVSRVHLDVCDGVFVPTRTIKGYEELARLETSVKFDVHLMVARPELACANWCASVRADRFFVHVEAVQDFAILAGHAHECGKTLGAAINPETPLARLDAVVGHTNIIQFMTVHPGQQGRTFVPEALERMRQFHATHPDIVLSADGGVTPQTAPSCVAAGASLLVSGSYIVRAADPARALAELTSVT
ncbi:MAG: hypothetical protein IT406_03765 [Candidatus Yanofskybacteria bacterium]|nr:hypothetical protein [Candidatus Yanofskybacteria bacterium]